MNEHRPADHADASNSQLSKSAVRVRDGAFNALPRTFWARLAFCLWVGFLAAYAGRLAMGWRKARRLASGRSVAMPELADLCSTMGVRRRPRVCVHPACCGPLLVGLWHPSIVLPETILESRHLRLVLAHELAHLKRHDLLWNWLAVLATAALPLHPLVWIGRRRWKLATEASCDAAALAATAARPAEYGRVLVEVATFVPPRSGLLSVAVAAESRWLLIRRLSAMQYVTSWSRRRLTTAALVCSFGALTAAVPWRVVARAGEQAARQEKAEHAARAPASGPATAPRPGDFNVQGEGPAFISLPRARIRSLTSGTVQAVNGEDGRRVKKGDVLVQLDATERQRAVDAAARIVKTAQERYEVLMQEHKAAMVAPQDLAAAKLELDKASDVLQQRKAAMDATRIIAPFDGVVEDLKAYIGSTIMPGDPIATVYDVSKASVDSAVPANAAPRMKEGDPAAIFSRDGTQLGSGEVVSVGPENDASGVTSVRVRIVKTTVPLTNRLEVVVKYHVNNTGAPIIELPE